MARRAVFRTDASATIGGGHVARCLALADALASKDWSCRFAVNQQTMAAMPALAASRHDCIRLTGGGLDDAAEIKPSIEGTIDLLIVDHYQRDVRFESACRSWAGHILVIDDLANRRHDADFLLDQTLGREEVDYVSLVPPGCRMLLGPHFALLRPQFARARADALDRRDGGLRRILICMGNSDPHDMTTVALRGIAQSGVTAAIDIVLGSISSNRESVAAEIAEFKGDICLHIDVQDMATLMAAADLAIGSSGVIAWERCAVGLPTIAIITADNQRMIAANLSAAGAVQLAGDWKEASAEAISGVVAAVARRPELLTEMSRKAAAVCDGNGLDRATSTICGAL